MWNPNLAYAVGLIATDGYISKDNRHITLTSSDLDQIITFKRCLGKNNKPTINPASKISKKISYRIQIGDVVLVDWLKSIGLHHNKSLTIGALKVPNKFYPNFVRGLIDGDGHIRSYIDQYNCNKNPKYIYKRLFIFLSSASKKHLIWVRETISELLKISGSFQEIRSRTQLGKNPLYSIKYSTKEAIKLANWVYYDTNVPCLLRKRLIVERYFNYID